MLNKLDGGIGKIKVEEMFWGVCFGLFLIIFNTLKANGKVSSLFYWL